MPFEKPSAGGSVFDCQDDRYLLKVVRLEDTESPEYGPGIKWVLNIATMDRQMVLDDRGFEAEMWQFSSAKLTPRAKGRKWVEAFLGRELDEKNDDGDALMKELPGKWAVALLAHNDLGRIAIASISPLKAKAAAPAPVPVAAGAKASSQAPASSPDEIPDNLLTIDAADESGIPFA